MKKYCTLVHDWKGTEVYTYDILKIIPQGNWEANSIPWIGVAMLINKRFVFVKYGERGVEFHPLKPALYMRFEKIGTVESTPELISKQLIKWLNYESEGNHN